MCELVGNPCIWCLQNFVANWRFWVPNPKCDSAPFANLVQKLQTPNAWFSDEKLLFCKMIQPTYTFWQPTCLLVFPRVAARYHDICRLSDFAHDVRYCILLAHSDSLHTCIRREYYKTRYYIVCYSISHHILYIHILTAYVPAGVSSCRCAISVSL